MTSILNGFDITLPTIILERMTQVLTGTMHYYIFRSITRLQTCSAAFDTLQAPIPHIRVYYICIHKLITFVTLLHLITTQ